ncbi:MAG: 50S ribosomal protein L14e [Candidatus Micrarchaeia archaeon]
MLAEEGRVCIKKYGRDAGSRAIITKVIDRNFVMIKSAKRKKERRCNIDHLEFLSQKVNLNDKASVDKILASAAE